MPNLLNVYALPTLAEPGDLARATVVVIDVLRASTTIAYALEAGAHEVVPCLEVDEAKEMAGRLPAGQAMLGGERLGVPIAGFDLGNSPEEYTAEKVGGKTLVFTTTNGTAAMHRARPAGRILIGSFVNVAAVCRELAGRPQIHLMCAGTRGRYSDEDVLLAGMLVERLRRQAGIDYQPNAQALTARESWLAAFTSEQAVGRQPIDPPALAKVLQESAGGQNLLSLGLERDILAAAQVDRFRRVPELDPGTFRIRLSIGACRSDPGMPYR
jgi:2-phosphosulfolactate phosphatase